MVPKSDKVIWMVGAGAAMMAPVAMWSVVTLSTEHEPTMPERAHVTRIIDGDTIEVRADGQTYTVRFARLDAPETHEPGGSAATQALRDRIAGETVTLDWGDDEGRMRGHYGRWLARVHHDGEDVEEWMVEQGHGELAY